MFSGASSFVEKTDAALWFIVGLSAIVFIGIVVTMIYFVVHYSRKKNPHPTNIDGHLGLELTWTLIPLGLFMGMFYMGWSGYRDIRNVPDDAMVVKVTARMWQWSFEYPNGIKTDTLHAVIYTPMRLNLTSMDVNHSLYIPAFRIKKDVIPGRKNVMWFKAIERGAYDIACAEFCGLQHAYMYTKVIVDDSASFDRWYAAVSAKQGKKFDSLLAPKPIALESDQLN